MYISNLIEVMSLLKLIAITIDSSIVRLHVGALDFAILNHQCVTLATILTEDSSTIERKVEVLGELARRIAKKADLYMRISWESVRGRG